MRADTLITSKSRLRQLLTRHHFWLVSVTLIVGASLHYTHQIRSVPISVLGAPSHLTRHALERVLLVLPVTYAAFTFGLVGGLVTLLVAVLIMLPRILLLSPYPADAFLEMIAVILVSGLVTWLSEAEKRQKRLRQEALQELEALSAIAAASSQSLDLESVLKSALDKTLQVMGVEGGGIYLLDDEGQVLTTAAHRGMSPELVKGIDRLQLGEGFSGRVAQSGEPLVVRDLSTDPRLTRVVAREEGFHSMASVPLASRGKVVGTLFAATKGYREFSNQDIQLLTSIGLQIGVAVQNARLYQREREALERSRASEEQMRFYVQHISGAQEDERKRIAQEVHDVLGHTLATVNMTLQASIGMIRADGNPRLLSMLGAARLHVKEGMHELRRALSSLAAHSEEPFYDKSRILKLTRNVSQATGLRVDLEFGNTGSLGTQNQTAAIYRLLQEGITNAIRHGNASYVDVHFQDLSNGLMIYIKDNGSGVGYNEPGFGIDTMHKRLSEMGGTLTMEPNIPRGTTLRAWIPSRRET